MHSSRRREQPCQEDAAVHFLRLFFAALFATAIAKPSLPVFRNIAFACFAALPAAFPFRRWLCLCANDLPDQGMSGLLPRLIRVNELDAILTVNNRVHATDIGHSLTGDGQLEDAISLRPLPHFFNRHIRRRKQR
jgi:hypothetical protein